MHGAHPQRRFSLEATTIRIRRICVLIDNGRNSPLDPVTRLCYNRSEITAALRDTPEAFGSTFARESSQPLAWFCDRLGNSAVFGAFDSTTLMGVAGLRIREGEKEQHKGLLWGMYVRPDARKAEKAASAGGS
jgi:hypothetical protein